VPRSCGLFAQRGLPKTEIWVGVNGISGCEAERGESAKTAEGTELTNLIEYCQKNKGEVHTVVVYALNRFARQNYDHHALRALLAKSRVTLRSVTEPIDDSPSGKLMEGVLSSFAGFDNNVRAARTTEDMKAALHEGNWPWQAPLGYLQPGMRHHPLVAPLIPVFDCVDDHPMIKSARCLMRIPWHCANAPSASIPRAVPTRASPRTSP